MGGWRLWMWAALAMMLMGTVFTYAVPSYACACAGENPGGSLTEWLFVGIGAFLFCGMMIVTLLFTIRVWNHRKWRKPGR